MKYESSILKRLIDVYGVVGNPRYISEIIKQFIVQGKECYPNLFTYQADWLAHIDEFGLTPEYTVSYTGQHIYAPNTKEKPVKRAILKGNTLVNIKGEQVYVGQKGRQVEYEIPLVKINTNYFIKYKLTSTSSWVAIGFLNDSLSWSSNRENQPLEGQFILNSGTNPCYFRIGGLAGTITTVDYLMIIEYQDGMENWDIPYFEGMQSVKLPGLTTTNEDGTKTNILSTSEDVELRGIGDVKDELDCLTGELTQRIGEIVLDGSENWVQRGEILTNTIPFATPIKVANNRSAIICDKFKNADGWSLDEERIWVDNTALQLHISKTKATNITELKTWLANNNVRLNFKVPQESIKTVDLTIHDKDQQKVEQLTSFDGGTHFTTSSQEGSLLPTLTVDVVTNLEETLKVCSLEGNTM